MLSVIPTKEQIDKAIVLSEDLGKINRSIMGGTRNVYGFLGEIITSDMFPNLKPKNTYDYDLIFNNKFKIDVKTKSTTVTPEPHFECSISTYYKQKCDVYVFVRILKDFSIAYLLGYITPEEYFKKAKLREKGSLDPNSSPRAPFYFRESSYNLPISELRQFI